MKPIIGVIARLEHISEVNDAMCVYERVIEATVKSGGIPIGIVNTKTTWEDIKKTLDLCDGIIMQGGSEYDEVDIAIAKYLYEKDCPTLGICLGMQVMGMAFDASMTPVQSCTNHNQPLVRFVHMIKIEESSKFYSILEMDEIVVNSRHNDQIEHPSLAVVGVSEDGVVEVVEDASKQFYIGVQWHPEQDYEYDILSQRLFETFMDTCRK